MGLGLEVVVGEPQGEPAPDGGLAAEQPRAHPRVLRARVGVVLLVDHDVLAVVGPAPALDVRIDVLVRRVLRVRRLPHRVLVEGDRVPVAGHLAPARVVVGPLHRLQLGLHVELAARFQQQDVQAVRREDVRGHAAGGTGADDDGVVDGGEIGLFRGRGSNLQEHGLEPRDCENRSLL